MEQELQGYYDKTELSEMFGVTSRTIQNWIDGGKLEGKMIAGKWFVNEEAVNALKEAMEVQEVIPVKQSLDFNKLVEAFGTAMDERLTKANQDQKEAIAETLADVIVELKNDSQTTMDELRKENENIKKELASLEKKNSQLIDLILREKSEKKSFLQRLFKS